MNAATAVDYEPGLSMCVRKSTGTAGMSAELSYPEWKKERSFMKMLGIFLCAAFVVWMVSCGLVLLYSREIAELIVRHAS